MTDKPDDPWKTETGSKIKAWYIMRLDLPMSQGKFGVQIGHGTDMIHMTGSDNPYYKDWLNPEIGNRRKVVLRAKSLEDVEKVKEECEKAGMIAILIQDAGLTEFGGATTTGLIICPHDDVDIPTVLKRAQSWRPTDGGSAERGD